MPLAENQISLAPEPPIFEGSLAFSEPLRGEDFLLERPTVPGTAKPVKSKLQ
jgi:hypothetical protein